MTPTNRTDEVRKVATEIVSHFNMAMTSPPSRLIGEIASAITSAVAEERERCAKAVCRGCELGWQLGEDGNHWRQILTSKDKKGKLIYNAADKPCLAKSLRQTPTQEGV